jgi:hypothetical protein
VSPALDKRQKVLPFNDRHLRRDVERFVDAPGVVGCRAASSEQGGNLELFRSKIRLVILIFLNLTNRHRSKNVCAVVAAADRE